MKFYNATIEVAAREYDTDAALAKLDGFHAALGESVRGWASATITLPGESLAQATAAASAVVSQAFGDAEAIAAEVMTEDEFDAREGWERVPDLLSVTEVAAMLKISRQGVLDRIKRRTLPATKVGRDYVVPRGAVQVESPGAVDA